MRNTVESLANAMKFEQVPAEVDGRACMAALRGENLDSREKLDALQQLCEQAFWVSRLTFSARFGGFLGF